MPDQNPRDFLLALLSDETRWASLDEKSREYLDALKNSETVLQLVFNFGFDLAQNAVALSERGVRAFAGIGTRRTGRSAFASNIFVRRGWGSRAMSRLCVCK
jgi:hypothetical protein